MWQILLSVLFLGVACGEEVCCDGAGCFTNDYPFDSLPLPECTDTFEMDVELFTRDNRDTGTYISRDFVPSYFNPAWRTIFIVHGWLGSSNNNWMWNMKNNFLDRDLYNVVIVGWQGSSQQLWYPQSASDTRTVGTEVSLIIDNLVATAGADAQNVYCTGHSLGSHVCGHAGRRTNIGRITGMDPAGPLFENKDPTIGLYKDCATLVDVMHTNGVPGLVLNLGTMNVLGHVDFYPAGGERQPGCVLDPREATPKSEYPVPQGTVEDRRLDWTPACSHMRAVKYYEYSIIDACYTTRQQCTDQFDLPGSCVLHDTVQQTMGFGAELYSNMGIFYLEPDNNEPYCP